MEKFHYWLGSFNDGFLTSRQALFSSMTLTEKKEEECPLTARTCSRKYPRCCVPDLGKLTFSQFWSKVEPIEEFTIHGLWPRSCETGKTPPTTPVTQADRNLAKDVVRSNELLQKTMDLYWPTRNGHLWANEWKKHGTFLSTIKNNCFDLTSERHEMNRYFLVTLSLYAKYSIMEKLRGTKVKPGNNYTSADFFNAMPEWKESIQLYCTDGELNEIRFNLHGHPYFQFSERVKPNDGSCKGEFLFPNKLNGKSSKPSSTSSKAGPSGGKRINHFEHDELK